MRMPRHFGTQAAAAAALVGIAFVLAVLPARPARGATPQEIDAAIKKGRAFILSQQREEGRWEHDDKRVGENHADHPKMQGHAWGGFTAISTYALLASSEDPTKELKDPKIAKAIAFLKKANMIGSYAVGVRAQVWLFLPEGPERTNLARKDLTLLRQSMVTRGNPEAIGLWDYDSDNNSNRIDHSAGQYGVLGYWACSLADDKVNVDEATWRRIENVWRRHQRADGAWTYDSDGKDLAKEVRASMVAAGVSTLFITQDVLLKNAGTDCKETLLSKHIDLGLHWMDQNFHAIGNNTYALYGVERIGTASGLKYFGSKDWYATGAETLVRSQAPDGSWQGGYSGSTQLVATSFAVLFLSGGRHAVAVNKLQYGDESIEVPAAAAAAARPRPGAAGPGADGAPGAAPGANPPAADPNAAPADTLVRQGTWNQRPRDVANLVRWMGQKTEADFHWQIVNLKVSADDLHDAPVLYIGGSKTINLPEAEIEQLRRYIEGGGLVLANANCAKPAFGKSFKDLGKKVFPKYEFRELPADHPIFTKQSFLAEKWKDRPSVHAVSNGVRELMILIPEADPAKAWQLRSYKKDEALFQLGANILSYSVDKAKRLYKGQTHIVKDAGGASPPRTVKVVRLDVGDNADPEPGGWRRLATIFKNDGKIGLQIETAKPTADTLKDAAVAHLTGTSKFQFTPAERAAIKSFVEQGGTLVIDAAGGSGEFATAAEAELAAVFGAAAVKPSLKQPLPLKHLLFNWPEKQIKGVAYRRTARETLVGDLKTPRLCGIKAGGGDRIGVFYSREDLSTGMVGHAVYGVIGYSPATATAVMRNIVLYAANQGNPAAADPGTGVAAAGPDGQPLAQPTAGQPPVAGTPQPPAAPVGDPLPF